MHRNVYLFLLFFCFCFIIIVIYFFYNLKKSETNTRALETSTLCRWLHFVLSRIWQIHKLPYLRIYMYLQVCIAPSLVVVKLHYSHSYMAIIVVCWRCLTLSLELIRSPMQYPLLCCMCVCVCQKRQMCQSVCQAAWPMRQQEVEGKGKGKGEAEICGQKENGQNDLLDDATNGYTSEQQNAANGQRAIWNS